MMCILFVTSIINPPTQPLQQLPSQSSRICMVKMADLLSYWWVVFAVLKQVLQSLDTSRLTIECGYWIIVSVISAFSLLIDKLEGSLDSNGSLSRAGIVRDTLFVEPYSISDFELILNIDFLMFSGSNVTSFCLWNRFQKRATFLSSCGESCSIFVSSFNLDSEMAPMSNGSNEFVAAAWKLTKIVMINAKMWLIIWVTKINAILSKLYTEILDEY